MQSDERADVDLLISIKLTINATRHLKLKIMEQRERNGTKTIVLESFSFCAVLFFFSLVFVMMMIPLCEIAEHNDSKRKLHTKK